MTPGDRYRARALELDAKAKTETNPTTAADLENLARAYRRLARQADQNALTDIAYETPARKPEDDATE
jgi:hypothetical protein